MVRMVVDTKLLTYDRRDALGGPDLADEPKGFGTLGEQTGKLCELLGGQPRHGPGRRLAV